MPRGALTVAAIAALFALATYTGTGRIDWFVVGNLVLAALCTAGALIQLQRRFARSEQRPNREIAVGLLWLAGSLVAAWIVIAAAPELRWELRSKLEFPLSEATRSALAEAPEPLEAVLYQSAGDPRLGETRSLLASLGALRPMQIGERAVAEDDEFASNTVLLRVGDRTHILQVPSEGAFYEALSLGSVDKGRPVAVAAGFGEGNTGGTGPEGFSGLAASLVSEGFRLVQWTAGIGEPVPQDTAALLIIDPAKPYLETASREIVKFIEAGGRAAIFTRPERAELLAPVYQAFGVTPSSEVARDPDAPVPPVPAGGLICRRYSQHPVVRPLDVGHVTFFPEPAALSLSKAAPRDQVIGLVFTGIAGYVGPQSSEGDFLSVAAAVRARRDSGEGRLVVFGDSAFASNRWLRVGYNLDLVMNAMAWLGEDLRAIGLRAKTPLAKGAQEPVVIGDGLRAFLGIGLVVPELLLLVATGLWYRQRSGGG